MRWRDQLLIVAALTSVPSVPRVSAFAQSDSAGAQQSHAPALIAWNTPSAVLRVYGGDAHPSLSGVTMPRNLTVFHFYQSIVESMIRESTTFRRQLQRIANTQNLRVYVRNQQESPASGSRAHTVIGTTADGQIFAIARIGSLEDPVELIAHELEHVLEYLDGVDLRARAALSGTGVRRHADGTFETTRAVHVGRTVARETSARR